MSNVTAPPVTVNPPPDIEEITVDITELTFDDLETVIQWQEGIFDPRTLLPLLDRIVVGGVRHRKVLRDLPKIMTAISKAMIETSNPPGPDGSTPLVSGS